MTQVTIPSGSLFSKLGHHLAVRAVLAGAAAGTVRFDSGSSPRSGLLLAGHRVYVAGDYTNRRFLADAQRLLREQAASAAGADGMVDHVLYFDHPAWRAAAQETLFPDATTFECRDRCYFRGSAEQVLLRRATAPLPPAFAVRPVDAALLDDRSLIQRELLLEELRSERASVADFLARSFGQVLLHGAAVAGWCLSEYNLGHRCEVGIAVAAPLRRRGLATVLGTALARQAIGAGVTEIGWHCWADNAASRATAERLGLTRVQEYQACLVRYSG